MSKKYSLIFCYDFLKDKYCKKDKKNQSMIFFDFNKLIREKIKSLNNNEFWMLFSNKDNKAIFYTGVEKEIDELDCNKFIEHTKIFFPEKMEK